MFEIDILKFLRKKILSVFTYELHFPEEINTIGKEADYYSKCSGSDRELI